MGIRDQATRRLIRNFQLHSCLLALIPAARLIPYIPHLTQSELKFILNAQTRLPEETSALQTAVGRVT
jgi:hypothetical protein